MSDENKNPAQAAKATKPAKAPEKVKVKNISGRDLKMSFGLFEKDNTKEIPFVEFATHHKCFEKV